MKLKTSHGTYVVTRQDGKLVHLVGTDDQDFRSVWHEAPPPLPELGLMEAAVTDGPLAMSTLVVLADGLVAFRRDGFYLCADPGLAELRFTRDEVGQWERFAISKVDGSVVRLPAIQHETPVESWVALQPVPTAFRPTVTGSIESFIENESAIFKVVEEEYSYAPITMGHEHLRIFQQSVKAFFPVQFGHQDFSFSFINKEQSKFVFMKEKLFGTIFDKSGFLTSPLFLNFCPLPEYASLEKDKYNLNFSYLDRVPEEDQQIFVFYDGNYDNYFHWWVECLVKFEIAAYCLGRMPPVVIWNGKPKLSDWQLDSLNLLGIEVIERTVKVHEVVRVKEVIWVDRADVCYVPGFLIRNLRDRVLKSVGSLKGDGKKIYIKRKYSRSILNDCALEEFLIARGYEPIYMENIPN